MIRIGVDIRPLAHPATGIGRYTREVLIRLLELTAGEVQWFLYADRPVSDTITENSNVRVRTSNRWNPVLSLWRTQIQYSLWARKDALDIFWSPRHHLPLFLPKRLARVVTIHDLVWRHYPETMLRANWVVERILVPASLKSADRIICSSGHTRLDVMNYDHQAEAKLSVIPLAANKLQKIDEDGCKNSANDIQNYFLFVGTQEPRKNLLKLLEAYRYFHDITNKACKLIICGGSGWNLKFGQAISDQHLEDDVIQLGEVSESRLSHLYSNATALILVSLYEGFGLPALEAMQYGVPVIGSNRSSIPEVVGEGGLLVDPYNEKEIAEAMRLMMEDTRLRQALSEKALQQSKKFSWDKTAGETLAVLRAALVAKRKDQG